MADRTVLDEAAEELHNVHCVPGVGMDDHYCPEHFNDAESVLHVAADRLRDLTAGTSDKKEVFMLTWVADLLTEGIDR